MRYLAIALIVIVAACGGGDDDPWTYGNVVEREFNPAHDVFHPPYWRDGGEDCRTQSEYDWWSGEWKNKRVCTQRPDISVPAWTQHVPDTWRIKIGEDSDGADEVVENHWINVAQSVYDGCQAGDRYLRAEQECVLR